MAPADPPARDGATLGFERLLFFSDAVFAIAITLLVLDLDAPGSAQAAFSLGPLVPKIAGFGLSFYVIGRYWMAHHRLLATVQRFDVRLLATNLCFLASVAFLPSPTRLLIESRPGGGPEIFYCLSMTLVGAMMITLVFAARRPALMRPGETAGGTAHLAMSAIGSPAVFLLTAAVAAAHPPDALWLLILLVPAGGAANRLGLALQARLDARSQSGARSALKRRQLRT